MWVLRGSVANGLAGLQQAHDPFLRLRVLQQAAEMLTLERHHVFLGHHRAGFDLAAADHVGDQAGDVEVVRADEAAVA